MNPQESNIVLDKIQVVKRQLDTAIWLWFNDCDLISVNTLTGAVMGVIDGLYQEKKWERPQPFNEKFFQEGEIPRKARNKLKQPETFAKHARWDADLAYEYNPYFTELYIHCAVTALAKLEALNPSSLATLFCLRFKFVRPHLYDAGDDPCQFHQELLDVDATTLSRTAFFQKYGGNYVGNPPRP